MVFGARVIESAPSIRKLYNGPITPFYTADLTRPDSRTVVPASHGRLTGQVTQSRSFTATYIHERNCNFSLGDIVGKHGARSRGANFYYPDYRFRNTWTYPVTNRLLLEAGHTVLASTNAYRADRGNILLDSSNAFGRRPGLAEQRFGSWGESDVVRQQKFPCLSHRFHAFKAGTDT